MDIVAQSEPLNVIYGLSCVCPKCEIEHPGIVRYVGQTSKGFNGRWSHHKNAALSGKAWPVARWIAKHGDHNIRHVILDTSETSAELDALEIKWIQALGTLDSGYNLWPGGRSVRGYKHSPQAQT